ncbi:MAG: phosphotransferase [bacterium]|nr:phosphotransferase [bacterium]
MENDLKLIRSLNKGWAGARIKRAGGQTNRNYIVDYKNKKFFVRLPWVSGVIDRRVEAKNILALSCNKKLGDILPKYYLYIYKKKNILDPGNREVFRVPNGTMVSEFVRGRIFDLGLFKKRKYQEKLVKMFFRLHSSGVRFCNKYDSFRDELGKYRLAAQKFPIQKILKVQTISNLIWIEKKSKLMVPISRPVPTHNDFLFQNFILGNNDKLYLLDFEYAGMNVRGGILYDFGYFFADNFFRKPAMNKDLFEEFLVLAERVYKRCFDRERIYWLALATPVLQIWWGLLRYFSVKSKKEKKYFKSYILKRVQGIPKLSQILK